MKPILRKIFFVLLLLAPVCFTCDAQDNMPKYLFGISSGVFVYQGDLTPETLGSYKTVRPLIQLLASKFINSSFLLRGNVVFGGLHGDEAMYDQPEYRQQRAFRFHSRVVEISAVGEWNILGRNYISRGFSPYVHAGAGVSFLRVTRDYIRLNAEYFANAPELFTGLNADIQHAPPKVLLVMPVGIGVRYYLSDKIGISAESTYRIMSNDYLDGFSQSVNPANGDHYYSHTVGVVYRVGKKNRMNCPVMKY